MNIWQQITIDISDMEKTNMKVYTIVKESRLYILIIIKKILSILF